MKLMCKLFGHDKEITVIKGIKPGVMFENGIDPLCIVERETHICKRCNKTLFSFDTIKFSISNKVGINFWGSAGICSGCVNTKCKQRVNLGFGHEHCPITKFRPKDKKDYNRRRLEMGDTIID